MRQLLWLAGLLLLTLPATAQNARPMVGETSTYVTRQGDDLVSIARAHRLAIEHLAFANGFPDTATEVAPGIELTIPGKRVLPANPPRDGLVLNLPERMLYLFRNGRFDRYFPVSIGEPGRFHTRGGQFHIIEKAVSPTWYPPSWAKEKAPVGPGPNNPLGDRWIGLSSPRVGLHGTNDPLNIGNDVTHGCIRLYPELVRELYEHVWVGMPIRIEYEVAKIGRGDDGKLYIANFPDVYQRAESLKAARNLLRRAGLDHLLEQGNLESKLYIMLGIPLAL
ncbi:MAG: L,D-transpeptidase family protein [Armatimonadetes bacterium]|nr:L,D-transpeptidase family protein [Armatimonadota bacterium]